MASFHLWQAAALVVSNFLGYRTKDIALYSPNISRPLRWIGRKYEQWKQRIVEWLDLPNTFPFIMLHAYFKLSVCRISTVDKETLISCIKIIHLGINKFYLMKKLNSTYVFFHLLNCLKTNMSSKRFLISSWIQVFIYFLWLLMDLSTFLKCWNKNKLKIESMSEKYTWLSF
jgi:hypothetical protein